MRARRVGCVVACAQARRDPPQGRLVPTCALLLPVTPLQHEHWALVVHSLISTRSQRGVVPRDPM